MDDPQPYKKLKLESFDDQGPDPEIPMNPQLNEIQPVNDQLNIILTLIETLFWLTRRI